MDRTMALITIYCLSSALNLFLYFKWMLEREARQEAEHGAEQARDALVERTRLLEKTVEYYNRENS